MELGGNQGGNQKTAMGYCHQANIYPLPKVRSIHNTVGRYKR